jgi:hypothetical protein
MHRTRPVLAAILTLLSLSAYPFAQMPAPGVAAPAPTADGGAEAGNRPIAGWSFTPSFIYAGGWDDNVLLRGNGDARPGDYTTSLSPNGELAFNGRRDEFSAAYSSTFVQYRALTPLNSFEQRGSIAARRRMTRRLTLFARASATSVPTTDLVEFVAVPFVRLGSRLADAHSGVEVALTRRTSMVASYNFQWVNFDRDPLLGLVLLGGQSQGASLLVRHTLGSRATLIADYDFQRATIVSGGRFDVQNTQAGVELRPWESTRLYGTIGFSRLDIGGLPSRTGPAWRAGLRRQLRTSAVDIGYSRSFVPALGFGGTTQNEQLTAGVTQPIGRRFYLRSSVSWARNQPLTWARNQPLAIGGLKLRSTWIAGSAGYVLRPWMRFEGFYDGTTQNIDQAGGQMDRNRVGFQIITTKPMRIR